MLVDGRKVAGILAEAGERVVLGIGVNVGSAPWPGAGAVERDRLELLVEILERLERGYDAWAQAPSTGPGDDRAGVAGRVPRLRGERRDWARRSTGS